MSISQRIVAFAALSLALSAQGSLAQVCSARQATSPVASISSATHKKHAKHAHAASPDTIVNVTPVVGTGAPAVTFIRIPAGTILPVVLNNDIYTHALRPGDRLLFQTMQTITLPSGDNLPAGTSFFANVQSTSTNSLFGPDTRLLKFDRMQLTDGTNFPIEAGMISGSQLIESLLIPPNSDTCMRAGQQFFLEIVSPAQVAVTGNPM